MAEKYLFFNSADGDRRRSQASDMSDYWFSFLSNGLFVDEVGQSGLAVVSTGQRNLSVDTGRGVINGYLYINDAPKAFNLDEADANYARIDRIVIRFDNRIENRYIKMFVLKGTPSAIPLPVELTRNDEVYELSIATIKLEANTASINPSNITDERYDSSVCGVATTNYASASAYARSVFLVDPNKNLNATNLEDAVEEMTRNLSINKSGFDDLGVATIVEWKNGSIVIKKSTLSDKDTDENYSTRTINYYDESGLNLRKTAGYILTYNDVGQITSEVLDYENVF